MKKTILTAIIILLSIALLIASGCTSPKVTLNVSAGVGLIDVLTELNNNYMAEHPGIKIEANFAASGTLMEQIKNGAPTDIFFTPSTRDMDSLQKDNLIIDDTRKNLLFNKLVLIVPINSKLGLTGFEDLVSDDVQKIAIGDPNFVPAGTYTQQTFDYFDITDEIKPKLVLASDVRQVLIYTESSNVDAGIVYLTDALTSSEINIITNAPDSINANIVFVIATIRNSKNPDIARDYINYLSSEKAKDVFEEYGFSTVEK